MPPRKVKVIKAKPIIPTERQGSVKRTRVAAYCRVSTELEEQQGSFNEQKNYYQSLIQNNEQWILAGIYADEGITGTKASKRDGFMRMINDCRKGKIDLILTKSITRFARNTLDSLKFTEELKNLGIAVIFEKENLNSLDENSKMLLTVLSSIAEEESRNISNNVRWSFQRKFENGSSTMGIEKLYGFDKDEDGNVIIIEEEAQYVRLIYKKYLDGWSTIQITRHLQEMNAPTCKKKGVWYESTVKSILTNEKYCGDAILQKTYCDDFINGKRKKNKGETTSYYVEDSHPAIVDRELFQLVQKERAKRLTLYHAGRNTTQIKKGKYSKYILSNLLICAECGQPFRRCSWTAYSKKKVVYRCYSRVEHGKKYCKNSPTLEEENLKQIILEAINEVISISEEDIDTIYSNMSKVIIEDNPKNQQIKVLIDDLKKKINEELSTEFPDSLRVSELTNRIKELNMQKEMVAESNKKISESLKANIVSTCNRLEQFDDSVVKRMISKIVVNSDNKLDIYFKSEVVLTKRYV